MFKSFNYPFRVLKTEVRYFKTHPSGLSVGQLGQEQQRGAWVQDGGFQGFSETRTPGASQEGGYAAHPKRGSF